MFTLRQLKYFIEVARCENITTAAEVLHVSQPAISSSLSVLENHLGVQLLIRHKAKGVKLTPAARQFINAARNLLTHAEELDAEARNLAVSLRGSLTLGCFDTIAPFYLPQLLTRFRERYPNVEVHLCEGSIDSLIDELLSGRCDIALLYDIDLPDTVEAETLAQLPPYVLVSSDHKLARRRSVTLSDTVADPMILLDLPHSRDYFLRLFAHHGLTPNIRYRTRNFEVVRGLVATGHGYSLLNSKAAHNLTYHGNRLVNLPLEPAVGALTLVLAKPKQLRLTKLASAFAAVCQEYFQRTESAEPPATGGRGRAKKKARGAAVAR